MSFGDHEMMAKQPILSSFVRHIDNPLKHDANHEALSFSLNGEPAKNLCCYDP